MLTICHSVHHLYPPSNWPGGVVHPILSYKMDANYKMGVHTPTVGFYKMAAHTPSDVLMLNVFKCAIGMGLQPIL